MAFAAGTTTDWLPGQDLGGMSWWDAVQKIQNMYGPNALAQLLGSSDSFLRNDPSFSGDDARALGAYTHARFAEQDNRPLSGTFLGDAMYKYDPTGGAESFMGGGVQPIDYFANPIGAHMGGDALELGRMGGRAMAGYGIATGASAAAGAGTEAAAAGGTGTGTTTGVSGSGGAAMPAAAPESASTLAEWGLTEVSPGVWQQTAAGVGSGAGAAGGSSVGEVGTSGAAGGSAAGTTAGAAGGGASTAGGMGSLLSNPQVIGGVGGALLGAMSGSGTKANTIQTEEGIPDWLMPYAKPALDRYTTDLANYNVDPYGIMPEAMQQFKNTVGGMYLTPNSNPYLEDYFRLGAERIKGSLSPTFGHMQAFGQHSGYNEALSRGLGDYAVGLYGGAYEKERDRQNQMVAASPAFLGQSSAAQFSPYQEYLKTIGSLGKSKETPYFTNPWSSILGGAMAGSQFGNIFK